MNANETKVLAALPAAPRACWISEAQAASGLDRASFDAALESLRRSWVVTLSAWDGRHGTMPASAMAGGIRENGRLLTLVERRD